MAQQSVGIGSSANDGTGDPLRTAFTKINENFTEVYAGMGMDTDKGIDINNNTITSTSTNADIIIDPNGTGVVELAANVQIDNGLLVNSSTISSLTTNGNITLTPNGTGSVVVDGITIKENEISASSSNDALQLAASGTGTIDLTAGSDVVIPANIGLVLDGVGAEKIESDGTDITITVGAGGDINVGSGIGVTFGNDGEKIEGDGTDLTITGNTINLTATTDVALAVNTGLLMAGTEKIESDGTDLSITVGAGGDINIGSDIGLTFGNDGEKIEGDGTDLTIASSGDLNISNTGTMVISGSVKRAMVTITGDDSITQIEHAGRINLLGEVGGNALVTLTLPAATGSGLEYKFIVSVVNTSSYKIIVADATDTIDGSVNILDADASAQTAFVTAAASDTVILNGTTSGGGSIGDTITLTDIATNQYAIEGQLVCAAGSNPATPFSATVS